MKVILLQEIKGQGGEGDVVEVKRGYAVNYLFPQKLAIQASSGNLKQLEMRRHNIAKRETERLDSADKIQAALADKSLTIAARVGEEGQLFGSVTTQQIAEKLKEELGLDIDRKKIDLHAPIKTAGEHSVTVSIYRDIKAVLTVNVVDENAGNEEEPTPESAEKPAEETAEEAAEAVIEEAGEVLEEAISEAEAVAVAVAEDLVEAEEMAVEAEALNMADEINDAVDSVEAVEAEETPQDEQ